MIPVPRSMSGADANNELSLAKQQADFKIYIATG
ncbi:hypothetical protein J2750_001033 [Methanococcoides alaskense]|uniref:Uncharacterized protein n=1 Tax=Methanococcoides alaskense TaxID=325778 RepID=A0AA90TYN0_9EURY|nr:hypothetical protein [Methanococcoides alaskense]